MSIDLKSIILIIFIIGVLCFIVYLGYDILTNSSNTNISTIESNNIETQNIAEETVKNETKTKIVIDNKTDQNITRSGELNYSNSELAKIYGTGLTINNENPTIESIKETYSYIGFKIDGNSTTTYMVPNGWNRDGTKIIDPVTGSNVQCIGKKISEIIEEKYDETTYEEVLEAFMENERKDSMNPDEVTFSTRELVNDGGSYTVIVKKDGFAITSYIVYIKGLYEYHLKFSTTTDDYDNMIEIIDNIFSSYRII